MCLVTFADFLEGIVFYYCFQNTFKNENKLAAIRVKYFVKKDKSEKFDSSKHEQTFLSYYQYPFQIFCRFVCLEKVRSLVNAIGRQLPSVKKEPRIHFTYSRDCVLKQY